MANRAMQAYNEIVFSDFASINGPMCVSTILIDIYAYDYRYTTQSFWIVPGTI